MPRHPDKRLRLVRVDRGTSGLPSGTRELEGPFPNECHCGFPECSWTPARERKAKYGLRSRVGAWETRDGRFRLEWACQKSVATRLRPNGQLRMWDNLTHLESWHFGVGTARIEMARRLDGGTGAMNDRAATAGSGSGSRSSRGGQ